jgi:hypothetical protein
MYRQRTDDYLIASLKLVHSVLDGFFPIFDAL